jgi:carbon monoxide dehydrogenase subunit G
MDLTDRYAIPASPSAVREALSDPEILQAGIRETVEALA